MTIHVTWTGILLTIGGVAVIATLSTILYGLITLWLFIRGASGK